jgi:hypothetical protein
MGGTVLSASKLLVVGGRVVTQAEAKLHGAVRGHLVAVMLHEDLDDPTSPSEGINVVVLEGDHNQGFGIVMSEALSITPPGPHGVWPGDLAEWVPGRKMDGCGRIVCVITPSFELLGEAAG